MIAFKEYWYDWEGTNQEIFTSLYGVGTESLAWLFPYLDFIGEYEHFHYLLFVTTVMFMMKYVYRKVIGYDTSGYVFRSYAAWLCALVVGVVVTAAIVGLLKESLALPRPYHLAEDASLLLYGVIEGGDELRSFPSGHVTFTTLWVTFFWSQVWGIFKPLLLLTLIAMCWFRIAIGAHFPVDVLAGLIIGMSTAIFLRGRFMRVFKVWS